MPDNIPLLIGNDVVSLRCAFNQSSFANINYIKKILTPSEIASYGSLPQPQITAIIWSCKESVCKILLKQNLVSGFNPTDYEVGFELPLNTQFSKGECVKSVCRTSFADFYCFTYVADFYVHTVASNQINVMNHVTTQVVDTETFNPETLSALTYNALLNGLAECYNLHRDTLKVARRGKGAPCIKNGQLCLKIPFSVSHDEKFCSFAFQNDLILR